MLRSESLARTGTLWPYHGVPYSQNRRWESLYRQDCSGFVSGLWGVPTDGPGSWGGYSTVTFVSQGIIVPIHASDLKMADAIGRCGPNTGGNGGHITWFEAWYNHDPNDNRAWIWEQSGNPNPGPNRRLVDVAEMLTRGYQAWRYVGIQDDPAGPTLHRAWPSYMPPATDYFGPIDGPNRSHGGYHLTQRPDIKAIQQRVITLGFVPGVTSTLSGWADGIYGPKTTAAVAAMQRALWSAFTKVFGQVWRDDWTRLFTY